MGDAPPAMQSPVEDSSPDVSLSRSGETLALAPVAHHIAEHAEEVPVSCFDEPTDPAARPTPAVDAINAVVDQWQRVAQQIARISDQGFTRPTRLGNWRIAELVAHTTSNVAMVVDLCQRPAPATPRGQAIDWYTNSRAFADAIAGQAVEAAREGPAHLREAHAQTLDAAVALLSTSDPARVVAAGPDGLTLEQLCVTRCVEAVIHGMDLGHSLCRPADIGKDALAVCIQFFAALLARSSRPPLGRVLVEDEASEASWIVEWGPVPQGILRTPRCTAITFLELATGRTELEHSRLTGLDPQSRHRLGDYLPLLQ